MTLIMLLSGVLICLASLWFLIEFVLYKYKVNRMMKNVKIIDGELPIIGNLLLYFKQNFDTPEGIYNALCATVDPLTEDTRLWIGNFHVVFAVTIQTIENILTSQETVDKPYFYNSFRFLTTGLFSAPTNKWRRLRKRLNPMFSPKFFPHYIDQMNFQAAILIDKLRHIGITTDYQDIHLIVNHYFFDIITSTHFGINTKQQEKGGDNVANTISRCTEFIFERCMKAWLQPDFIFSRTELYRQLKCSANLVEKFMTNFSMASEKYQENIDTLKNKTGWKSYSKHAEEVLKEIGSVVTPAETGRTIADLIVAGADTSGVVISCILYHLGQHPEYQELAYNEIIEIINQNHVNNRTTQSNPTDEITLETIEDSDKLHKICDSSNPDWEFIKFFPDGYGAWTKNKLDRLTYLEMLIKEALRMTCPALIARYLKNDIDVGGYTIPSGSNVVLSIRNVHRNPKYYERPTEFYPQHFSKERVNERPKMAFIPFSFGPRDCPGKAFGVYAIKCALVEILRNFKIESKPVKEPVVYKFTFMTEQSEGYPIKLVPR